MARKYKESEAVIHAIHAHHGDVEAKTVLACITQAADAISSSILALAGKTWKTTSNVWRSSEEVASSFDGVQDVALPFRQAVRSGSW